MTTSPEPPTPSENLPSRTDERPDHERDSSVGLIFSVSVELKRRRGVFHDLWEARLTAVGIVLIAAVVIAFVLTQIFDLLHRVFMGS